jgi:hypothetical protein
MNQLKKKYRLGTVVHTRHPSHLGGGSQEDDGSMSAQRKIWEPSSQSIRHVASHTEITATWEALDERIKI